MNNDDKITLKTWLTEERKSKRDLYRNGYKL